MTDLAAQLVAVEEAAKKATPGTWTVDVRPEWDGPRLYVEGSNRWVHAHLEDALYLALAANLPFRAVREELERLRRIEAAAQAWAEHYKRGKRPAGSLAAQQQWMDEDQPLRDALARAVLCPDPAGGER